MKPSRPRAEPSFAFPLDVRDDDQCAGAVSETVRRFGGLDAVVYATGRSPLFRLEDAGRSRLA